MTDLILIKSDARRIPLKDESVQCVVTSPPYWGLRDYGIPGQLGLESTPEEYVANMVGVFRELRRVLKRDGVCWVNLGDSYTSGNRTHRRDSDAKNLAALQTFDRIETPEGLKPKDLVGIPWRVAFALQADGWWLRQDIIWHKPNPMPESVTDRCTKAHEYLFLLTKSARYFWDQEAVKQPVTGNTHARGNGVNPKAGGNSAWNMCPGRHDGIDGRYLNEMIHNNTRDRRSCDGQKTLPTEKISGIRPRQNASFSAAIKGIVFARNIRSVWTIPTQPYPGRHFATFPEALVEPCILAGSRPGDVIFDPFGGSGTVARVSVKHNRQAVHCDINYHELARDTRCAKIQMMLNI